MRSIWVIARTIWTRGCEVINESAISDFVTGKSCHSPRPSIFKSYDDFFAYFVYIFTTTCLSQERYSLN